MEELIKDPTNVLRIWGRLPADNKAFAARERDAHVARVKAQVDAGTYETPEKLDVTADRLVDLLNKPDLAEAERAEFDRVNEGDRFDGLS